MMIRTGHTCGELKLLSNAITTLCLPVSTVFITYRQASSSCFSPAMYSWKMKATFYQRAAQCDQIQAQQRKVRYSLLQTDENSQANLRRFRPVVPFWLFCKKPKGSLKHVRVSGWTNSCIRSWPTVNQHHRDVCNSALPSSCFNKYFLTRLVSSMLTPWFSIDKYRHPRRIRPVPVTGIACLLSCNCNHWSCWKACA